MWSRVLANADDCEVRLIISSNSGRWRGKVMFFLLLFVPLSLLTRDVGAQWSDGGYHLARDDSGGLWGGAVHYRSGTLWVGMVGLWKSLDSGQSWRKLPFPQYSQGGDTSFITSIDFLNSSRGLVTVANALLAPSALFETSDGGNSWNSIDIPFGLAARHAKYLGDGESILIQAGGHLFIGSSSSAWRKIANSWEFETRGAEIFNWAQRSLLYSSNRGLSWESNDGPFSGDMYSATLDSCAPKQIIIIDESPTPNSNCAIYLSTDIGASWHTGFAERSGYLGSGVGQGRRAIYVSTTKNGVLRSKDRGRTWENIGGPSRIYDSRSIAVIDDNTVIGINSDGYVWRTTNSGGSWVSATTGPSSSVFEPATLFLADTLERCDTSVIGTAYFRTSVCDDFVFESQGISGSDAANFEILTTPPRYSTGLDSVQIAFHPSGAGEYHATYTVLINGTSTTVELSGVVRDLITLVVPDTLQFGIQRSCTDSTRILRIASVSCRPWRLDSVGIIGPDAIYFAAGARPELLSQLDSLIVAFGPGEVRHYTASLRLFIESGRTATIPLSGDGGEASIGVTLAEQSGATSVIGGEVDVPVAITAEQGGPPVRMFLHFDTTVMRFQPSALAQGVKLISESGGGVEIEIVNPRTMLVMLAFAVFPQTSDSCGVVTLDSVVALGQISRACATLSANRTMQICGPGGCGTGLISAFLLRKPLRLSLTPNPTSSLLRVKVSGISGEEREAKLEIFDNLGKLQRSKIVDLQKGQIWQLNLVDIPSGTYHLIFSTPSERVAAPFVIE